ncbi:hypothetical protein V6N11_069851 [Hibiscus sabdariffa]|uniref:Uncharacterized protein n=1 Tax=Hibiscus sabdariffa TaxID=183260 RepID=A0ABR2Q4D9_9ROSI
METYTALLAKGWKGFKSLGHHGNPSGRPPEPVTDLGLPLILERPASPLALEEQQLAKKSKGDEARVVSSGLSIDEICIDTDVSPDGPQDRTPNDPQSGLGKETYASMAAKGHPRSGNKDDETGMETEEYGHSMESYASSSSPMDAPRLETIQPIQPLALIGRDSNLYGSWMIASSHRRRNPKATNLELSNGVERNQPQGS